MTSATTCCTPRVPPQPIKTPLDHRALVATSDATLLRTGADQLSKRMRNLATQLVNPASVQQLQIPTRRRDQHVIGHDREEVLRELSTARVRAVKPGGEHGGLARRVELEVHEALGEEHALVVRQGGVDGRDGARGVGAVDIAAVARVGFQHQTADQGALGDEEEFVGARVQVGHVEAAGVDEADGEADVGADEGGELVDAGEADGAACRGLDGVVDELVGHVGGVGGVGDEDGFAVLVGGREDEGLLDGFYLGWGGSGC